MPGVFCSFCVGILFIDLRKRKLVVGRNVHLSFYLLIHWLILARALTGATV